MVEVNEEDKIKAEIYFNEQQQIHNQPQIYYNGMFTQAPTTEPQVNQRTNANQQVTQMAQNEHMHAMSQSPRLKPITIIDKQLVSNQQGFNNANNPNSKKNKNGYEKIRPEQHQTRYRSQHWNYE